MQLSQYLKDGAITEEMLRGAREIVRLQQESSLRDRHDPTAPRAARVAAGQYRNRYAASTRPTGPQRRSSD
ncbi:MAG: hypothetical protein AAGL66_05260 [Pseudomonadota bacterium]